MGLIANELRLALTAVQYFTRVPVPRWVGPSEHALNASVRYFPLVGIGVGLITGAIYLLALQVLPQPVALILAMIAGVLVTGGFHEDGLADTCDGFGGGWDKAQVLTIMKDSRVGTYGVLGLVFALALKFFALMAVPLGQFIAVAVAAHAFSRFMAVTVISTQRYVRDDASSRAVHAANQPLPSAAFALAAVFAIAPLAWLGAAGVAAAIAAVTLRVVVGHYFYRRLGGYTGDCLGAIQQTTEIAFYLAFVAWIST